MQQVIDIKKVKDSQEIQKIANHNLRQVDSRNVNKKKTPLNNYLIGTPNTDVIKEMEDRLEKCPKYRKDAVKTVNLVLSASPEFFSDKIKAKQWEKDTQAWAEKTFGKENIIYSVVHYDEKTPHFHICLVPIKDGKLNASYWFDGPAKLKKIHDGYNEVMKPLGLKRGQKAVKSNQTELTEYYKKVNSSTVYDRQLDKKLDDLFEKLDNPTTWQKLKPWSIVDEVAKPLMKQLKNNLSHYRTKSKNADTIEKELKKAQSRVSDLELKLTNLGIDPDTPFLEIDKYTVAKPVPLVEKLDFQERKWETKQAKTSNQIRPRIK